MFKINYELSFIGFIYDLITLFTIIIVLLYLFKKNKISEIHFILLAIFCTTPLFFNNIILDWTTFPDQSKYSSVAAEFRGGVVRYNFLFEPMKNVVAASYIFAFFPVLSFQSINTIAFINKALVVFLFIFFKDKKTSKFFLYSLLFFPSMLIYSSLSLRDILVVFFMLLGAYYFFEKKYEKFLISIIFLYLIKPQNAYYAFATFAAFKFLFDFKVIRIKYIVVFLSLCLLGYYGDQIISAVNNFRQGFIAEVNAFHEVFHPQVSTELLLSFEFKSIFIAIQFYLKTFLYPLSDSLVISRSIFFLDNVIYSLLFFLNCILLFKKNKSNVIFWLSLYLIIITLLSVITINEMTHLRYKMPWVIFFIFCLDYTSKNKNSDSKIPK